MFGRLVILGLVLAGLVGAASGQPETGADAEIRADAADDASREDVLGGLPIEEGWVVIDGQLVAPPYVIGREGDQLTVNGQLVLPLTQTADRRRAGRDRRDGAGQGGRGEQNRGRGRGGLFSAEWVEARLMQGDLLVIVSDEGFALIQRYAIPQYLERVEADEPLTAKVMTLNSLSERPVHSAVWQAIIEDYRPDPRLTQAATEIREEIEQRALEREQRLRSGGWMNWFMPMAAIGAVLAGLGVLLRAHRIGLSESRDYRVWRHIDTSGRRSRLVLQLIGLLILLNGLDLAFTLLAQQTGQFVELSPIGERMITKPIMLGIYKAAVVALGVGILIYLRRRRAAEIVAWWMCALYVLVLVRWAAVNTLLLA